MARIVVVKKQEPEAFGEQYASSLEQLPGEEELVSRELGLWFKRREVPDEDVDRQLEQMNSAQRPHIQFAEIDGEVHTADYEVADEQELGVEAVKLTNAQVRQKLGIDKAHERGFKGQGQHFGVIDTGILAEQIRRFGNRLRNTKGVFGRDRGIDPGSSKHGAWCLSVIGANCPAALVSSYQGLDPESGSGSYSGIIACIEAGVKDGCTDLNMSLGGPKSQSVNLAVKAARDRGVRIHVAAGNEQRGKTSLVADEKSPASAPEAETWGAKDSDEVIADFSNWGRCLDASCYGKWVQCEDPDLIPGFWSGTSMATPEGCSCSVLVGDMKAIYSTCVDTPESVHKEGAGIPYVPAALDALQPEEPDEPDNEEKCAILQERFDARRERINRLRRGNYRILRRMDRLGCQNTPSSAEDDLGHWEDD